MRRILYGIGLIGYPFGKLLPHMAATLVACVAVLLCPFSANSAPIARKVVGVVTDSITGERLPFVNVYSKDAGKGTVTDENGVFTIHLNKGTIITAGGLGYVSKSMPASSSDTIRISLVPSTTELSEVVIKPKKQKYSKRNNPAVDLMQRVRHDRKTVDPEEERYYSYEKYDKTLLGLNDFHTNLIEGNALQKKLGFLENFIDTAAWTGKRILDLSLKEKTSVRLLGKESGRKEIVTGVRSHGLDESINQDNVRAVLDDVLREINVYDNDITLMQNRFVSPLSPIAADYYMFHITDTVRIGDTRCVELSFAPKNAESFGFNGKLFIPADDSVKYVRRVSMRVPKAINLNYVDNIFISQNYEIDSIRKVHKTLDDLSLELQILPGTPKFYGSRITRYRNFSYKPSEEYSDYYSKAGDIFQIDEAENQGNGFWDANRLVQLSYAESQMGNMMNRFRRVPLFYWTEKTLLLLVNGYFTTGGKNSKFDIGPVNTFISYNSAEGMRFRLGGMTTANLNNRLFARGYLAYGLRDRKFKYNAEVEYSFVPKKYHSREFPMNAIRATYQYDRDQLGQHYLFTNADNVFLSLKRMRSDLITYRRLAQLEYNLELRNYFSFNIGYRHETQEATPWVNFTDGYGKSFSKFRQGAFTATLRYAPGEKYVQSMSNRLPVNMDAPIITLTHEYGPRGLFGADFEFHKTELSMRKRFWFSAFGYVNVTVKGGKIWSQVQFPALLWQNANISYTIQPESFTLLNPMEFAMDQYASLDLQYFINGAILNRIPLVKKLKLREVFTFKGFVGSLTRKNNPEYNDNLFRFPADAGTIPMGKTPYMEIGAGIDNIFTILRVDYVWRLTYRDRPGIDRSGLRIALHFSF